MRTYAKKKEHVNAPIGPFTTFSHCAYGCNIRKELISAAKSVGGDDPGAPQSRTFTTEYAYQYDDIGNRNSSFDLVFFNSGSGVAAHYEYAPFGSLRGGVRCSKFIFADT